MKRVVLNLDAQIELVEILRWLSDHSADRAEQFAAAYDAIELSMSEDPEQFPEAKPGIRRALIGGFKYSIFFVVEEDEAIILAVTHQHWRNRLG